MANKSKAFNLEDLEHAARKAAERERAAQQREEAMDEMHKHLRSLHARRLTDLTLVRNKAVEFWLVGHTQVVVEFPTDGGWELYVSTGNEGRAALARLTSLAEEA